MSKILNANYFKKKMMQGNNTGEDHQGEEGDLSEDLAHA